MCVFVCVCVCVCVCARARVCVCMCIHVHVHIVDVGKCVCKIARTVCECASLCSNVVCKTFIHLCKLAHTSIVHSYLVWDSARSLLSAICTTSSTG